MKKKIVTILGGLLVLALVVILAWTVGNGCTSKKEEHEEAEEKTESDSGKLPADNEDEKDFEDTEAPTSDPSSDGAPSEESGVSDGEKAAGDSGSTEESGNRKPSGGVETDGSSGGTGSPEPSGDSGTSGSPEPSGDSGVSGSSEPSGDSGTSGNSGNSDSVSAPTTPGEPEKPTHTHTWVEQTTTVTHEATGHYETKVVKEAWDEEVYEYRDICNKCGKDVTSDEDLLFHYSFECDGSYSNVPVKTGTIHHDAETEQVWVEDTPAYTETVRTGTYKCSGCGATK